MKINKIAVTVSKTIQVKQFEPVSVSVTVEAQIDADDDFKEVRDSVHKRASSAVLTCLKQEVEKYGSKKSKK